MNLPIRLENAITKLYTAFHNNELLAMDCSACAVGNICDNDASWVLLDTFASSKHFAPWYIANQENTELALSVIKKSGYLPEQLQKVEMLFLEACNFRDGNKQEQFKGLCAVVEYLCELDNIPNVMDYTKLFETENNQPKHELSL